MWSMTISSIGSLIRTSFRIKSVELRGTEQAVDRSSSFAASIGASEEIDDMTAMPSCRQQQLS
jgi:hypothetical protein